MITKALILSVCIILLALLSFSSFISTIIGLLKKRKNLWIISLGICLSSVCLFSLATIYTSKKVIDTIPEIIAPGPDVRFAQITGLEWPKSAKVITTSDEFFVFDWEFYVVFKTNGEVLKTWLSNSPPWGIKKWKSGPIPSEIPYGIDRPGIRISNNANTWYAAKEYCCDDLAFHSGNLLIVDLDTNTVFLKSWDY
jgi:hypothetical protein